ncbi:MAG TPA: hypothetical protein VF088_00565 [Pyrinomonadaceae bacterium]
MLERAAETGTEIILIEVAIECVWYAGDENLWQACRFEAESSANFNLERAAQHRAYFVMSRLVVKYKETPAFFVVSVGELE